MQHAGQHLVDRQLLTEQSGEGQAVLRGHAQALRNAIVHTTSTSYREPAQRLYDVLIRPFEQDLADAEIETLVFVPDGALRTIPIAALHDGAQFLVERYATAVVPGMTLLDPRPIRHEEIEVLLSALTVGRDRYNALPSIEQEVEQIQRLYPAKTLFNEAFITSNVRQALVQEPYSFVHIASHGQFKPDVDDSFILTYDDQLNMNELESLIKVGQFREEPVELLVLSACETAAGSERAALGLAGIAVKAGARSALASLWFVYDEAATRLVSQFYEALAEVPSKAEALQAAQLVLLRDSPFRHPGFWSPFLLVGNWL